MIEKYAEILMEFATSQEIDRTFTYKIPEDLIQVLEVGMRVLIPFGRGNKTQEGYVIGLKASTQLPDKKMKSIHSIIDQFPVLSREMLALAFYIKRQYNATLAGAIDLMLPPASKGKPITLSEKKIRYVRLIHDQEKVYQYMETIKNKKNLNNQYNILKLLLDIKEAPINDLTALLQISDSAIRTLAKHHIVQLDTKTEVYRPKAIASGAEESWHLNHEQEYALSQLRNSFLEGGYETFLLHGVTGSGKTEIFLQLIETVIEKGQEAIVLVPEISLTPQAVNRFQKRFGSKVGITHSRLSPKERMNQWVLAKQGKLSVMIGPRSAVFTPFQNLKIMIVDEEHETSYKSETTPKYDTKEVAKRRMKTQGGLVLLASATPDLGSYYKTQIKEYTLLELTKRVYDRPLPHVDIIDMRHELSGGNWNILSSQLHEEVSLRLEKKEQVMLFLNRRGHSTFVSCRSCGYAVKCDHCSITMTYHASENLLMCHYCGKSKPNPEICPSCSSQYIRFFGDGTQKVEQEVRKFFPDARLARMDTDTMTKKNSYEETLGQFKDGHIDILIGTQMIAKGHDFPNVTLVGVIAADSALYMQDFRASERTFQLLTQVTGRAGRGDRPGGVIVQTYNPDHYCIEIAARQDYLAFYHEEIMMRKQMNYPPFSHIFSVLITSDKEEETIRWANRLMAYYKFYNQTRDFVLYGPIPAVISKIDDIYRWRIIIKSDDRTRLNNYGLHCITKLKELDQPSTIDIQSDIDPSMLY